MTCCSTSFGSPGRDALGHRAAVASWPKARCYDQPKQQRRNCIANSVPSQRCLARDTEIASAPKFQTSSGQGELGLMPRSLWSRRAGRVDEADQDRQRDERGCQCPHGCSPGRGGDPSHRPSIQAVDRAWCSRRCAAEHRGVIDPARHRRSTHGRWRGEAKMPGRAPALARWSLRGRARAVASISDG